MASSARRKSYYENFLGKFPGVSGRKGETIDAWKFAKIWEHYDSNNSGYIDDEGLEQFLRDLLSVDLGYQVTTEQVKDLKDCFMAGYDTAGDGRFAITELAEILPTDENFILLFRQQENLQSTVDLLAEWENYDKKKTGYINKSDLHHFIKKLLGRHGKQVPGEKIGEYVDSIVKIFDKNDDGHLSLTEMARLLAIKTEENFLITCKRLPKFQDLNEKEKRTLVNEIFDHYDKGRTGVLEGSEIDNFVKDLHDYTGASENDSFGLEDSMRSVMMYKKMLMDHCDTNKDGRLSKNEVLLILGLNA